MASHGLSQHPQERKVRAHQEQALKCPRCASTNTKFCYYNNYSLSQPRYFCKGCRRYWTQGGSLRNVPVGGGCRKNKRSSSSSSSSSSSYSSSSSSSKKVQDQDLTTTTHSNPLLPPPLSYDPSDLTFPFAGLQKQPPMDDSNYNFLLGNTTPTDPMPTAPAPTNGFLHILRSGFVDVTNPSGFSNLYYGYGDVNGGVEMATGASGEEGGLSFEGGLSGATASTTTSQGSCKAIAEGAGDDKVFTGLPWQVGNMDSATRDCWNGVGSSLQGLINSSLL